MEEGVLVFRERAGRAEEVRLNLPKYMYLFEGIKFAGTYKSVYRYYYYCSKCGIYVRKDIAKKDSMGRPLCPRCGKQLRIRPKHRRAPPPEVEVYI